MYISMYIEIKESANMIKRFIYFIILVLPIFNFIFFTNAKIADNEDITIKEGNLALSSSQQPGPLLGFGQNIIDKNDLQGYFYADYIKTEAEKTADFMPGFLYGIRDDLSIFVNLPITRMSDATSKSTSVGVSVQAEYAYYSKTKLKSESQATIVLAISGPNGSMIKQVVSNRQSSTFFLGGTYSYLSIDWYLYGALGGLFTIRNKTDTAFGDNFLYQGGIGRNFWHAKSFIYLFLVEMLGDKFKSNFVNEVIDLNSGGNIIFLAPSIWISSEKFIFQAGISVPVYQKLIGNQNEYKYQIAFNLGWKF